MQAISTPTLLVDEQKARRNIAEMAAKARKHSLSLRPHFKTHRSDIIGEWFRDKGIHSISVSNASMANQFAEAGWKDITIAFPVNLREMDLVSELAGKVSLNILADDPCPIIQAGKALKHGCGIFLKIDTGYGRAGISWKDTDKIKECLSVIRRSPELTFRGWLTHNGLTYDARGKDEVEALHKDSLDKIRETSSLFSKEYPDAIISVGDTPSCSLSDNFDVTQEIRPGNFVYYDLMQWQIGSCSLEQIAVAVACPVVSIYPSRGEILVYSGAIHLSKEHIEIPGSGNIYGMAVSLKDGGWTIPEKASWLTRISQEHGIISATPALMETLMPGDLIGILPVHSCLVESGKWQVVSGK